MALEPIVLFEEDRPRSDVRRVWAEVDRKVRELADSLADLDAAIQALAPKDQATVSAARAALLRSLGGQDFTDLVAVRIEARKVPAPAEPLEVERL